MPRLPRGGVRIAVAVLLPIAAVIATVLVAGEAPYRAMFPSASALPDPATRMLAGVLHGVLVVSSTVAVGFLVYAAFVRVRVGADRMSVDRLVDLRAVRWSAAVWALAAGALAFVDAADANGISLDRILVPGALGNLAVASYLPSADVVTCGCALAILVGALVARSWQAVAALAVLAMVSTLPDVVTTQVLVGPNHDFGSDAAILGTPALAVLAGLAWTVRVRLAGGPKPGRIALRRTWLLVAIGFGVVAATDVILALFELVGSPFFSSATAWLWLATFVVLAVLLVPVARGVALARSAPDLDAFRSRSARLLGAVGVLGSLLVAGSIAMSRIPPPQFFVPFTIDQTFFGYNVDAAPTFGVLALDWRANILFITISAVFSALYVAGVVRLRRRGDRWPVGRTVAWLLGWAVVVITTSSGLGRYSSASFSLHMVLHMALNMLAPLLLVLGGPITLALRALAANARTGPAGPREWIAAMLSWRLVRSAYNPLGVFIRFVGSYYVLYFTPIFEQALRYHWAHQLMNVTFLEVGYLFYGIVIGVDAPPKPLPHIGKLGMVLAAMPFHAFFGVAVMTSKDIIAKLFYQYIDAPWMHSLAADQYLGGGIAWAAGELPLIIVIVALVTQWARQDRRAAARLDRHLDAGTDESFDAYNAMLQRLASRDRV